MAGEYDESLPGHVQEHYLRKRARLLGPLAAGGMCLDVGCGTGRLLERVVGGGTGLGVDLSTGMLRELRRLGRGRAVRAGAAALPFPDASFDLVWSVAVLHHLVAPERVAGAVREMLRVTRPGGRVVIWDHNPLNPYWPVVMARAPQDRGDERLVPAAEVEAALRAAGVRGWRLTRSGWMPDFCPRWATPLVAAAEALLEALPLARRVSAHNVFVVEA